MTKNSKVAKARRDMAWGTAMLLMFLLRMLGPQEVTLLQLLLASAMLAITVHHYLKWAETKEIKAPVLPIICAFHFLYFGAAVFTATHRSPSMFDNGAELPESAVSRTMLVGLCGLIALNVGRRLGMASGVGRHVNLSLLDIAKDTPVRIRLILAVGIATNIFGFPDFGAEWRHVTLTLLRTIPIAAFLWLFLARSARRLGQIDATLAAGFFLTKLIAAAGDTASLGGIVEPLMAIALAAVCINRGLPWTPIVAVAAIVLFLQPSKGDIRQKLASGTLANNPPLVLVAWVEQAISDWEQAISGNSSAAELSQTSSRLSLITLAGVVMEKTPDVVPFQQGADYPKLLLNFVPRVLWPDKPTVNESNQFFQVAYGLTNANDLSKVSIACGFEAEGYMNFAWPGVIVVSTLVGIFLAGYERIFFSQNAPLAATAIGLALLPGFWNIESQLVVYLGGLAQDVLAACIILWSGRPRNLSSKTANHQSLRSRLAPL